MTHSTPDTLPQTPVIWVLADDRAGNRAQCLGVADRLGVECIIKEIRYTLAGKLPNAIRGNSLLGVSATSRKELRTPWPNLVIAAGRRTAPVARWIKAQSGGRTKLVQLMWPDAAPQEFDCIVLPSHDRAHGETAAVLRVLGAPHRVTEAALKSAEVQWKQPLSHVPPEYRIAVLVGGSTRHSTFTKTDFSRMGQRTAAFAKATHGSLFITTSRRTGKEGEAALLKHLNHIPHHLHNWRAGGDNPYLGYLALADAIVVSADSIAMCSEACATQKTVFIYQPKGLAKKHRRFVHSLIAAGYAYPLEEEFLDQPRTPLKSAPLDSAATVAEHIRTALLPEFFEEVPLVDAEETQP